MDVDIPVSGVTPRKRHEVNRLQYLSRPAVLSSGETRIAFARPVLQLCETPVHVGRFPGMVVLTSDNDQVLALTERLDANIVIWIACVPDECIWNLAPRHLPSDRISPAGDLLRVDRDLVIDRRIG